MPRTLETALALLHQCEGVRVTCLDGRFLDPHMIRARRRATTDFG